MKARVRRITDYGGSCKPYDMLVRLSDVEAIIAQKDAEILEQCRLNGMGAERVERCPHCGMPAPKAPAMQEDKL